MNSQAPLDTLTDGIPAPALVTARDVSAAADRLTGVVRQTPLQYNDRLSAATGARIWVKREDLQPVRSYKMRGAYLFLDSLTGAERAAGVVTASAGNHAQGVAFACHVLGIDGRIFVPSTTPRQKRDRIRSWGGDRVELRVVGDSFDESAAAAHENADETGAHLVPPFDDERVVAGQGTAIREAVIQLRETTGREPDAVVVPVGGGGLLAGTAAWLTDNVPAAALIGVEPAGAASMAAALENGGPLTLSRSDGFVDGAAVARVGDVPYAVVASGPPSLMTVAEGAVCTEMLDMYQVDGIIAEPAGALAPAALTRGADVPAGGDVIVVVSGGNNDVSRYGEILERSLVHEGLRHYFLVTFPQEPGALRRFLDEALGPNDDIVLFEYTKRNNRETGPALVGLEIGSREDLAPLLRRIGDSELRIERIDPKDPIYRYVM